MTFICPMYIPMTIILLTFFPTDGAFFRVSQYRVYPIM